MDSVINAIDWLNVLAGSGFAAVVTLVISIIKGLYTRYVSSKDLPYPIAGVWYSAEFDDKGEVAGGDSKVELSGRNTFNTVKIKRSLGSKIIVEAISSFDNMPQEIPTKWKVRGKIVNGDTLIGIWKSKIKYTNRNGTCTLKFIDQGRAVGFWSGTSVSNYPSYGYWLMSRSKKDVEALAKSMLDCSNFKALDLAESTRLFLMPIKKT